MSTFLTLALVALPLGHLALADQAPYTGSDFQSKDFGLYPTQTYESSPLEVPVFQVNQAAGDDVDSADRVFISPRGTAVGQIAPMIFNSDDLSLVWSDPSYKTTFGVRVQEYNNSDYITFWRGAIKSAGYGSGSYIMLDHNYNVAYNLTTKSLTVGGDIHEIELTDDGTALMSAYEPMEYDLTAYNITNGWLADSIFEEIDIATNNLIFSWRASEHIALNASYADPGATGISQDNPYDFFHINSIEKDDSGNYLISARHTHGIYYINGTNGDIIWTMGGKDNQFEDKSDGQATNFAWQHDARWRNTNLTEMTLFDNGAADWIKTENETRGLWLSIDYDDMSVTLKQDYISPEGILSISQGSVQVLSNGNVFMGYGSNGAFIEYTNDGKAIWDVQFGIIGNSSVQSYRAYKQSWQGFPGWNPSISAAGNGSDNTTVYMSWNGATEIKQWAILASNSSSSLATADELWKNVTKTGFETNVTVGANARYIRAAALNADGEVLGATGIVDVNDGSIASADSKVDIGTGDANTTVTSSSSDPDSASGSSGNDTSSKSDKDSAAGFTNASSSLALGVAMTVLFFFGL
ncbi:hypothetical protein E4T52_01882 [Aureobasidium sp. EXF-3400]|nr:hypothetical protein E4T51_05846 [Aureobasidium sp. EXF-12344]KAI4783217.1 hypothetical protein E4T52_01882 [Aureobasidium sp. EXF-3400]